MMYVHYEQAVEAMTKGMSQAFIAIHPAAVVDMKAVQAQMEGTIEFLHSQPPMAGSRGVHAPGEGLDRTRAKNRENGIPRHRGDVGADFAGRKRECAKNCV